jgi:uncharacterized membrane protein
MMAQSISIWQLIRPNFHMGWNLWLALVPLVLSFLLFQESHRRSLSLWLGVGVFIAFLPNAPYTLTDIIHFLAKIQVQPPLPTWATILLMIEFGLYFLVGFQSYVFSLINLGNYLQRHRLSNWILPIELFISALCSAGIYLGRFERLNSWDIVTASEKVFHQTVEDLMNRHSIKVMLFIFVVITVLYYLVKTIDLSIMRARRKTNQEA